MIPAGCASECRGCKHREWTLEESLNQKFTFLNNKLSNWSDFLNPVVSVNESLRWGYRSKVTLNANWDEKGWHFGMVSRDELIDIPNCPLHKPVVNEILALLRECLPAFNKYPLAYYVQTSGQVVLVMKTKDALDNTWLTGNVIDKLKGYGVEGLWVHYNPSAGRRLFEKTKWELLFGEIRSIDTNGLYYGSGAFQQLIPDLYNRSLNEVSNFFGTSNNLSVVDLYCGTGTSMSRWFKAGANVFGVESSGESVECARLNLPNAKILRGACRQRIPQIREWVNQQRELDRTVFLYVNPPRTGVEPEVLDWIIAYGKPDKIAYLSCSAGTLSKNLKILTDNGYQVSKLIPYDFFPQTIHVECLALIERI